MEEIVKFENEVITTEIKHKQQKLILTSNRVRYFKSNWGESDIISIMLTEVCSVSIHFKSNIIFIILTFVSLILTFTMSESVKVNNFMAIGIGVSLFFGLGYFLTRKHLITIASAGDKINFNVQGLSNESVIEFLDTLEIAKISNKG